MDKEASSFVVVDPNETQQSKDTLKNTMDLSLNVSWLEIDEDLGSAKRQSKRYRIFCTGGAEVSSMNRDTRRNSADCSFV